MAVIGVPHEKYVAPFFRSILYLHPALPFINVDRFGEAPRAYVVGKGDKVVTGAEITKFVAEHVAAYKHLVGGVEVMDSIPKSATGKILRKELVARYKEELK